MARSWRGPLMANAWRTPDSHPIAEQENQGLIQAPGVLGLRGDRSASCWRPKHAPNQEALSSDAYRKSKRTFGLPMRFTLCRRALAFPPSSSTQRQTRTTVRMSYARSSRRTSWRSRSRCSVGLSVGSGCCRRRRTGKPAPPAHDGRVVPGQILKRAQGHRLFPHPRNTSASSGFTTTPLLPRTSPALLP